MPLTMHHTSPQSPKRSAAPTSTTHRAALRTVKALYQQGQYKECAAHAEQRLVRSNTTLHPIHTAFLSFYAGCSLESVAAGLHPLASGKLELLKDARGMYEQATEAVTRAIASLEAETQTEVSDGSGTVKLALTSKRPSLSPSPPPPLPPLSPSWSSKVSERTGSSGNDPSDDGDCDWITDHARKIRDEGGKGLEEIERDGTVDGEALHPSPLRIRKLNPDLPFANITDIPPIPPIFSPTRTPPSNSSGPRYTSLLGSLHLQLSRHTTHVAEQISRVDTMHATRRVGFVDLWVGHGDEEVRALDRKVRLERLRLQGWTRARFSAERYQALAERALAGL